MRWWHGDVTCKNEN